MRTAVQRYELLTFKLESYRHCGSFRPRAGFSVAGNVQNFRILENGSIEVCCLFRIAVKPQEWSYFLHVSPFTNPSLRRREQNVSKLLPLHYWGSCAIRPHPGAHEKHINRLRVAFELWSQ